MIESVPMFRVICDRCKVSAQERSEFFAWATADQALNEAEDSEWLLVDGKTYCRDCTVWDDEKDELVPKGPECDS